MKYDDDEIERHMSTNHIAPLPKHTTSGEIGQQLGSLKNSKLENWINLHYTRLYFIRENTFFIVENSKVENWINYS